MNGRVNAVGCKDNSRSARPTVEKVGKSIYKEKNKRK